MKGMTNVNWLDMCVDQPVEVAQFYQSILGLKPSSYTEKEGQTSFELQNEEGDEVLGICDIAAFEDWVRGWVPYVEVDDFDDKVALVEELGGVVKKQGQYESEGEQKFCLIIDPSGAPMMLHERILEDE